MQQLAGQRALRPALPSCRRQMAGYRCPTSLLAQPRSSTSHDMLRKPRLGLPTLPSLECMGFALNPAGRGRDCGCEGRGCARHGFVKASAQSADAVTVHDDPKEADRKEMRTVFDFERWEVHRSNSRYFRHILGLFQSRVIKGLAQPLLLVMGVATGLGLYMAALQAGMLPAVFPGLAMKIDKLFGLTVPAMSLLLVFRTNASYGRWDEARKMWGLVLNRSRDITIQGMTWIPEEKAALRAMLCRWVPAFSKTMMCHLRKCGNPAKELEGILLPHEIQAVLASSHRPNYVLQVLGQIIKAANLPIPPSQLMMENLTAFVDCLGGCERILRTPIPLYYTRHTSRFLSIWMLLLPFTLFPTCGWATLPMSGLIAFLLLGVDEIGVAIEEPFSILPLETMTGTILANVRAMQAQATQGFSDLLDLVSDPGCSSTNGAANPAPQMAVTVNGA